MSFFGCCLFFSIFSFHPRKSLRHFKSTAGKNLNLVFLEAIVLFPKAFKIAETTELPAFVKVSSYRRRGGGTYSNSKLRITKLLQHNILLFFLFVHNAHTIKNGALIFDSSDMYTNRLKQQHQITILVFLIKYQLRALHSTV